MALKIDTNKKKEDFIPVKDKDRPFSRINFYLMGGCLVLIILGFLLMSGGGSTVDGGFNPEIFSNRRIITGPLLAFLGFLLMAFAIVYNPSTRFKTKKKEEKEA